MPLTYPATAPIGGSKTNTRLEKGNPRGEALELVGISLPLTGGFTAEILAIPCSMLIVGRLGAASLAAVGLSSTLLLCTLGAGMDVLKTVGVFVAQCRGGSQERQIGHWLKQGLWSAALLSAPLMFLLWILPMLLHLAEQSDAIVKQASNYLHAAVYCVLPSLWSAVLSAYLAAMQRTRPVMWALVASLVVNGGLCYLLVSGRCGFRSLGVAGAGYARSIAALFTATALTCIVLSHARPRREQLSVGWKPVPQDFFAIFALGAPVAVFILVENGILLTVGLLMGWIGTAALAASQVVLSVLEVGIIVAFALGEGTAVRVGYWAGAGRFRSARIAAGMGTTLAAAAMSLVSATLWVFAKPITSVFVPANSPLSSEVLYLGIAYLRLAAIFQVVDGLQVVAAMAFWGLKDTWSPLGLTIVGLGFVGVGGGYLLAFPLHFGGFGLWWGLASGLATTAGGLLWRLYVRFRSLEARDKGRLGGDQFPYFHAPHITKESS